MNKYEEKELNEIISIEDNMYLADNTTIFNDSHGDDRYLNLYEFRNTDKEYKLTDKGYVLKENKKGWWFMTKDIAKGTARGTAKLTEGVGSLALATLEKMNVVSEGTVNDFSNFYQENIYDNEGFFRLTEPETLAGGFAEGISQFLVPGLGAYGAMAKIFRGKGVWQFLSRTLSAEAVTVSAAQVPGDPNFASFLSNFLDIDQTKADSLTKEFYIYITTPENVEGGYDADAVFNDKFKAIIGDAPMGPIGETLVPLFKMFARGVKKLRGNKEMINEIEKTIVNAPDNQVFDIDNPPPGVIEDKMPQKGDVDYEEPASGGLSKDKDAMDDLNKDIAAQVEEVDNKNIKNFNAQKNNFINMKVTKPIKEFDKIINGTLPSQDLVVFKPNTPIRIKTAYFKITDDPDGLMSIQENVVGADIYNKYVDINKSEKKLKKFIKYVASNYDENNFETIMKKAGVDEDAYE
ncbi:hypothetical protein [uncultured Mediterranean phage uvMED]|nr:hypothetical protein [uncultured Mediterranean phage uvMED]BAR16585.1 hypothetical protein [uncultured Mediterranean phage uvMED]